MQVALEIGTEDLVLGLMGEADLYLTVQLQTEVELPCVSVALVALDRAHSGQCSLLELQLAFLQNGAGLRPLSH